MNGYIKTLQCRDSLLAEECLEGDGKNEHRFHLIKNRPIRGIPSSDSQQGHFKMAQIAQPQTPGRHQQGADNHTYSADEKATSKF